MSTHLANYFPGLFASSSDSMDVQPATNFFRVTKRTALQSTEKVGGKAHNLIKLVRMGGKIAVPETFVLSCNEYAERKQTMQVSEDTKTQIKAMLDPKQKYSVRSSANVEDGQDSAFAGKFTTTLNVPGDFESISKAIVVCWQSLVDLAEGAPAHSNMGVVVMKQVDSSVAGVLFQANPVTLSRATQVITSAFGQGEGVVGGTLAVDTFYLRESTLEIKSRNIAKKETRIVLGGGNDTKEEKVEESNQNVASLTDAQVLQVAKMGKAILQNCQSPQDIEFCYESQTNKLFVLQTRPITTLNETLVWTPPDNGLWRLNGHSTTPMSKFYSPMWVKGQSQGGFGCTVYCGAAIQAMDACDINGFGYYCMRQPGPKKAPKALPPPFVLRMVMRLTAQSSMRNAQAFWQKSLWRDFMLKEYPERKKAWRSTQDIWEDKLANVGAMSNSDLAALLKPLQDFGGDMYTEHAQVTMYNLAPVAWFAIRAIELTKCSAMEAFACIDGFSPFSKGLVGEFKQEVELLAKDAALRSELEDLTLQTDTNTALAKWKQVETSTSEEPAHVALRHILRICKYRLVDGYDCANPTLVESPCVLFNALATAIKRSEQPETPANGVAAFELVRAKAKTKQDQDQLEQLVQEARLVSGLRDERALLTDLTACGICHHFLLECGKRISEQNAHHQQLACYASLEELQDLLTGKRKADALFWQEMEERKTYRDTASIMAAPPAIGGPVLSPGLEYFPSKYMGRSVQCVMFVLAQIFDAPDQEEGESTVLQNDPKEVVGFPAGVAKKTQGIARVIVTPEDCALFKQGEICVTKYPSSVINMILHKTNGIVTDMGGILCHAAICAREEDLPCVVGCHTATIRIKTGDLVEIDGQKGTVRILN